MVNLHIVSNMNRSDNDTNISQRSNEKYAEINRKQKILSKSILAGFGVLLPQACHLGYDPFNDPEEPLATQICVTDGQKWALSTYQLNKTALHKELDNNQVNNVCWYSPEMTLYEEVNI